MFHNWACDWSRLLVRYVGPGPGGSAKLQFTKLIDDNLSKLTEKHVQNMDKSTKWLVKNLEERQVGFTATADQIRQELS